jgi:hypothetical protein
MSDPAGFEAAIKPLFRERDRKSMLSSFDLWSHADVSANSTAILRVVDSGEMPCDLDWPAEQVAVFRSWVEAGKPA